MNNFVPLLLPAVLGLIAGFSHGMASHYTHLPMSFTEETSQLFESSQSLKD
jgi:hypothetical protein